MSRLVSRDLVRTVNEVSPTAEPQYNEFFNEGNIKFIREGITSRIKSSFPQKQDITATREDIENIMWEIYTYQYEQVQVMVQKAINILANLIETELSYMEQGQKLDPHIMNYDQSFGISDYDQRAIKLNQRKYHNVDYNIRR